MYFGCAFKNISGTVKLNSEKLKLEKRQFLKVHHNFLCVIKFECECKMK